MTRSTKINLTFLILVVTILFLANNTHGIQQRREAKFTFERLILTPKSFPVTQNMHLCIHIKLNRHQPTARVWYSNSFKVLKPISNYIFVWKIFFQNFPKKYCWMNWLHTVAKSFIFQKQIVKNFSRTKVPTAMHLDSISN